MVSLYSLIIFFFTLVVLYSAVALALSLAGWLQKKWISRKTNPEPGTFEAVNERIDRLKTLTFNVTVALVLFCITPFAVILFFMA